MTEYDKNWAYKQGSEKPRHYCPYCGNYGYMMTDDLEAYYVLHECEVCDSSWYETQKEWSSSLVNGIIEEA